MIEHDTEGNRTRNKAHYDTLFRGTSVDAILDKVRRHDAFLDDATRTDTSWVALYDGGFRDRLRGARVLELGSGDGLNSLVMAAAGADVVSIDISDVAAEMLTAAAERLGLTARVTALAGDFSTVPLPAASFDFVVGKAFLHHLTHELEDQYLRKAATLLRPSGEARFAEPAVNSAMLDRLRWIVPVPGRPSALNVRAFAKYRAEDPHPARDNSSEHYRATGRAYFESVDIRPLGAIERFHRMLPEGTFNRRFRRLAFRAERWLPRGVRGTLARAQLVRYWQPRRAIDTAGLAVLPAAADAFAGFVAAPGVSRGPSPT
ncbi:MAG: class I SAM-dependent methyltransferase [Acidobacteria bacterium]|nr:class I SAM-dependent methyltransferase [Acidobacteriota bacterium]